MSGTGSELSRALFDEVMSGAYKTQMQPTDNS